MNKLGVMHGRLSPPKVGVIQSFPWDGWREEFHKAQVCGLSLIEWIFEADRYEQNPILLDEGIDEIRRLSGETGVSILSVCADYFMDLPLLRVNSHDRNARLQMLEKLIFRCVKLGVKYIELPFVDNSAASSRADILELKEIMRDFGPIAKSGGVVLCLETDLGPSDFSELIQSIDHPNVRINYDIGNSASLGYDTTEELRGYGPFIATVHIKDRVRGGGTVPLGSGNAKFDNTFSILEEIKFDGPFILQAARNGDEVETVKGYVSYLKHNFPSLFGV